MVIFFRAFSYVMERYIHAKYVRRYVLQTVYPTYVPVVITISTPFDITVTVTIIVFRHAKPLPHGGLHTRTRSLYKIVTMRGVTNGSGDNANC